MGFRCGIVGLPNVGKSTLFNALTKMNIAAENFPFCTIDPNVGVVPVPDNRLDQIQNIIKSQKVVPTSMQFIDIAGLVKGASSGAGKGNEFLTHVRVADALAHVVRCFEDPDVIHIDGVVDPIEDAQTIDMELCLADLENCEKATLRLQKKVKAKEKDATASLQLMQKCKEWLSAGHPVRSLELDKEELDIASQYHLLTIKPMLYVANISENALTDSNHSEWSMVKQLELYAKERQCSTVVVSAHVESQLVRMSKDEQNEFMDMLKLKEPTLNNMIRAGYDLLNLRTFFTAGKKEVRAWTFVHGQTAYQVAGIIHTDFQKGFIRAKTISLEDFIKYKGEQGAKEAGRMRLEGKDYRVQDGDVLEFLFKV